MTHQRTPPVTTPENRCADCGATVADGDANQYRTEHGPAHTRCPSPVTTPETPAAFDVERARTAWDALDAGIAGLLANACKSHRPYMGCPMDCGDVANALDLEFALARPLMTAALDEIARLRGELGSMRPVVEAAERHHLAQCQGKHATCLETVNDHDPECAVAMAEEHLFSTMLARLTRTAKEPT